MNRRGVEFSLTQVEPGLWKWQFQIGDTVTVGKTQSNLMGMAARRVQQRIDRELGKPRDLASTRSSKFAHVPPEVTMERYTHQQNLAHYRRLLAESERDPVRNEVQHNWLLKLLADEEAEDAKPQDRRH